MSTAAPTAEAAAAGGGGSPRVVFVGLGGGSCSGKTTLAKHILRILRAAGDERSFIVHQDDFAPREDELPWAWNGDERVRDWDTPHGSINFGKMYDVMQYIRLHGTTPPGFSSHDKLNVLPNVPIPDDVIDRWAKRFKQTILGTEDASSGPIIVLVDGFLAYYDPRVRSQLDVRFFTRCSRDVMKSRRAKRSYTTAETVWQDPPGYYDNIVWPAYVLAHKGMFENEDVERGALRPAAPPRDVESSHDEEDVSYAAAVAQEGEAGGPVRGLIILDERSEDPVPGAQNGAAHPAQAVTMAEMVERACGAIADALDKAAS